MDLQTKIGNLLMIGFSGTEYNAHLKKMIREHKISNVILFSRNIESLDQLYKLTKTIHEEIEKYCGVTPFIAIDQEGGVVTRIFEGATFAPGAMTITASGADPRRIGKILGSELIRLGINMNLAPVLDVNNNPLNPVIGVRSFSEDPAVVARLGTEYFLGLQEAGVIPTAKHFPGHGDVTVDSHLGLPVVAKGKAALDQLELYPFREAIARGVKGIMSAHIIFSALDADYPATMSKKLLTGLLRDELRFQGLVISDCMQMKAIADHYSTAGGVVQGLKAGLDIALISHTESVQEEAIAALNKAIAAGELTEAELEAKLARVLQAKAETKPYLERFYAEKECVFANADDKEYARAVVFKSLTLVSGKRYLPGGKTLFVTPEPFATTIAEDDFSERNIVNALKKASLPLDHYVMPLNGDDDKLLPLLARYEQVVVASYNAILNPEQSKLINRMASARPDLFVIGLRNPYDFLALPRVKNFVTLYEYTPNAIGAVISYLQGELAPQGKLPITLTRRFAVGVSVYPGLAEYRHADNLAYLERAAQLGARYVFMSGHMPEAGAKKDAELAELIKQANRCGLKVILDVSKPTFTQCPYLAEIYALRLDWGFSLDDIVSLAKTAPYLIELNASTLSADKAAYLISRGVDPARIRVSHNFYPKPETGLSFADVAAKNKAFHQLGFAVMAYISCADRRRGPLSAGLVTIEAHRTLDLDGVLLDMKLLDVDTVCFGDAYASDAEILTVAEQNIDQLIVPVALNKAAPTAVRQFLTGTFYTRSDAAERLVRFSPRCKEKIAPFGAPTGERFALLIDNELYQRYNGELTIVKRKLTPQRASSCLGKALISEFALEHLPGGYPLKFKIKEPK